MNKLHFENVNEQKRLVAESTYQCIKETFSLEEQKNILVASINPNYMDGKSYVNIMESILKWV